MKAFTARVSKKNSTLGVRTCHEKIVRINILSTKKEAKLFQWVMSESTVTQRVSQPKGETHCVIIASSDVYIAGKVN